MNILFILIYAILVVFWIILLASGSRKYAGYVAPLDPKKYMLKDLYPVGFELLEKIKYKYNSNLDKKRIQECRIIFGEQYGEYYYRVNMAEKATFFATFLPFSFLIGPLFGNLILSAFGIVATGVMVYYSDTKITDIMKERQDGIEREFSNMVSKMALLINAGMITREAWRNIAEGSEGVLYDEMRVAVSEMENGVSEIDAYIHFGDRCYIQTVKKFVSMLAQNLTKGNKELVEFLKEESALSWEEKKHYVKRKGEEAANKLMIPLGMILIGIFAMILVPVVSKLGF